MPDRHLFADGEGEAGVDMQDRILLDIGTPADADFVVVDAGSRNGVAVSVRGRVEIEPGTRLLVGDKMMRLEAP